MKKITLMAVAVLTLGLSGGALAGEEKVDHYEGKEFSNADEAMKTLQETSEKMAKIAADEKLDVDKMEQIHEISYITEDAVAFLDKKSKYDLSDLAEELEEVHLSSEDHEVDELRRHFIAYQAELASYFASKK